jgi:hypothetical protein
MFSLGHKTFIPPILFISPHPWSDWTSGGEGGAGLAEVDCSSPSSAMDRPLSAAWPALVVFRSWFLLITSWRLEFCRYTELARGAKESQSEECDSADAESFEVGEDGSIYGRGDEEGVFSADAEGLSMSIIMNLIPLFGSKSGRLREASRGADRWPSNRLFVLKPTHFLIP